MNVALRQRRKGDKISLYLDYYHKGKRQYEYLQLYLVVEPEKGKLSKAQKDHNKETLQLAESIKAKRQIEIQNAVYGFEDVSKAKANFFAYVEQLIAKRKQTKLSTITWTNTFKHLKKFQPTEITFAQIDKHWVQKFKDYLQYSAISVSNNRLNPSTQNCYFRILRTIFRQAQRDQIIKFLPVDNIENIRYAGAQREFLTLDELQKVADTDCAITWLKKAFLFSAMTGLRWSDISKMTWAKYSIPKNWVII